MRYFKYSFICFRDATVLCHVEGRMMQSELDSFASLSSHVPVLSKLLEKLINSLLELMDGLAGHHRTYILKNDIYIAICTVKLVKVINSIWSSYYQFHTIITCTDTHSLLRGVLKRRYLKVHEGLKQVFTSYPICQFYIFSPLPIGLTAHLDCKMESLHFL